ncbi:hypothetical protein AVT26_gp02 [Streptomyces phage Lannister]|uniref:Uncharacterized protein n=1 Tax=Streptomyces phage Lannister TaxID=1674927 RepID=A0A0K1Y9Y5_9CAUD|nr:hypothetical protein AVT26_gp02 [Streptomyces phage Lannister]AKY03684.1 hypothetical protein SEA_LANNISTER_2 [Streptomyces phage Lannister]
MLHGPPFRRPQSRRASSTGAGLRPATAASLLEHTAVAPLRVAVETHCASVTAVTHSPLSEVRGFHPST